MRPLSDSAVARCETATTKRCRCRCKGAAHGVARGKSFDARVAELVLVSAPPADGHDDGQRSLPWGA